LSLILVGLPDLRETLKRNVLQSLTARIPIRVHLAPHRRRGHALFRVAAKGKSDLVDATLAEAAIRDCAEALL
jgi:type II secretory pathway predicted ATPase ExeA